jgi:hypothetical protein
MSKLKILVACEFSGIVRDAFTKRGHDAMSCDLLPTERPGKHYQGDVFDIINAGWDMMIAFPPCTDLAVSGAAWFERKEKDGSQKRSIEFFMALVDKCISKIAIENPIGIMSTHYRKPDQIIQPWMFGHDTRKATCLWLKNLPLLKPTNIVEPVIITYPNGRKETLWHAKTGKGCGKIRSTTFSGIAEAMAEQWG